MKSDLFKTKQDRRLFFKLFLGILLFWSALHEPPNTIVICFFIGFYLLLDVIFIKLIGLSIIDRLNKDILKI